MTKTPTPAFQIPFRHRLRLRLRRHTPLLVWVMIALLTIPLYVRQEVRTSLVGYAAEIRYSAAPEQGGRLKRLEVKLNQEVLRDQIVATFEDEALLLQLQEAREELNRLTHQLALENSLAELESAQKQIDEKMNLRRFLQDASNFQIEYLVALAEQAQDRITLQGLELTLDRTRQLGQEDLTSQAHLDEARIAFEGLSKKVEKRETALDAMLTACKEAESRVHNYQDSHIALALDADLFIQPLKSSIEVQKIRIEEANLAIGRCVLRAPATGRIEKISRFPGEVVAAGEPVVSVLVPHSNELVAYLPEQQILALQVGDQVRIRRRADTGQVFTVSVASLGSGVEEIPRRTSAQDLAPSWGLPVIIPLPQSTSFKPGEAFEISF